MEDETKAVRGEIDRVLGEVNGLRQDIHDEFKAVHSDIADLRERLTRVETLLGGYTEQPDASDVQP